MKLKTFADNPDKEDKEKQFLTWQILRKGNYYNGQVTDEMLKEITLNFKKNGPIPIGIGHVNSFFDDSLPAEGWIENKKEFGVDDKGNFVSKGVELFEPLKSYYAEGRYRNWSAVIARPRIYNEKTESYDYGSWELRAVDLLGRATPAIKNLKDMTSGNDAKLSKFTVDAENENVLKFTETGNEIEIMMFSFSGEIEPKTEEETQENTEIATIEEVKKMDEKLFNEMKAEKEATEKLLAEMKTQKEENEKLFAAERASLQAKAEESLKKFSEGEFSNLKNSMKRIPEELASKLFTALEKTVGSNVQMSFGEETETKKSVYGILADCFNQLSFSSDQGYFSDMPESYDPKNEDNSAINVYSDPVKSVKAIS